MAHEAYEVAVQMLSASDHYHGDDVDVSESDDKVTATFHQRAMYEANRLIRDHGFLISPHSARKEYVQLYHPKR